MKKNIFESEVDAKDFLNDTILDLSTFRDESFKKYGSVNYHEFSNNKIKQWKQSGIIQKSAYEELMEWIDDPKNVPYDNFIELKQYIQAYHDEKHSLSPAVKKAREKTFNALFDYIIRILSTIPGVDTDKLNQLVQDVIQSERQIVDAMIKKKE